MSNPTSRNSIALKDVEFAYQRGGPKVLEVGEFRLGAGESCFLYGPSGCGKTTLLGVIAGVLEPQRGTVEVMGEEVGKLGRGKRDRWRGEKLGYIFQMFNLIPYLSVRDNILLPTRLHRGRSGERLGEIAAALGIEELLERGVLELSVGQQQRVAAARALIGSPQLVIADEPTSALDAAHRERFLELLLGQTKAVGAALLFVSHDQSLAGLFEQQRSLPELNRAARGEAV